MAGSPHRRIVVILAVAGLVLLLGIGIAFHYLSQTNLDRYACADAGVLVAVYMRSHDGAWPRGWDDLKGVYRSFQDEWERRRAFEDMMDRVQIDFTIDGEALRKDPPDRKSLASAIKPRRRIDFCHGSQMAEGILLHYLEHPETFMETTQPAMTKPAGAP
ncbi:MAG: hypothetical protein NTW19_20205 [Planctomycetota bacterium]|nr:hypothetical protein [Planctomycetota bacterium]